MAQTKVKQDQLDRPHYAGLYFSTGGTGGGDVLTSQKDIPFDVVDPATYGMTATAGSGTHLVTVQRAGVYNIVFHMNVADASTAAFIVWTYISTDGGTTYVAFRQSEVGIGMNSPGKTYSWQHYLPAGTKIRLQYYAATAIRAASAINTANDRYFCGPKLTVTEIR